MAGTISVQTGQEQNELETAQPVGEAARPDPVSAQLLASGRLKESDLKRAVTYREQHGGDLVTLLVRLGLVSERDVAEAESEMLNLPLVRAADLPDDDARGDRIDEIPRR